jgi:MFS family permease
VAAIPDSKLVDPNIAATSVADATMFEASSGYRHYVVWLLFLVYTCNFVDRQILSIVIEPIKREFGLHDWQLGLLSGLAFSAFYSTMGIPIARLADRRNRVNIIAISIVVWSAFTAVTGTAKNFWHLLIARIGVGVGEAGCSPPAYSLISDYFDQSKRTTALSIYSMGVYAGGALGFVVGGQIAHVYGWRAAFFAVGLPGLIVALLVKLTLREPPRGFSEQRSSVAHERVAFKKIVAELWSRRSFRHLSLAAGLHSFAAYGVNNFYSPFFMRTHGMTIAELSAWLAFVVAVGGLTGTYVAGRLCDSCYNRTDDPRWYLWIPAGSLFLNFAFGQFAYSLDDRYQALFALIPFVAMSAAYLAPSIAATHRLVGLHERAQASAVLLLILNFIGLGLGPMFNGAVSDAINAYLVNRGVAEQQALADGLRWAIRVTICINLWSALHYILAARTLREDIKASARA